MMDSYPSSALAQTILHPPTTHSRDPGGLLPMGIESMMGQDPVGTADSEESVSSHDDDGIIQNQQHQQRLSRQSTSIRPALPPPSPEVMALLAGMPPPPPPENPPPPRRRRSRSTPRVSNSRSSRSGGELPMEVSFATSSSEVGEEGHVSEQKSLSTSDPVDGLLVLNPVVADLIRKARNKHGEQPQQHHQHIETDPRHQYHRQVSAGSSSVDPPEVYDLVGHQVLPNNQATPRLIVSSASTSVGQENRSPENAMLPPQRSPVSIATEPTSNHHPGNKHAALVVTSSPFLHAKHDTGGGQQLGAAPTHTGEEGGRGRLFQRPKTPERIKGLRPRTPERLRRVLGGPGAGGVVGGSTITGSKHRRNNSEEVEHPGKDRNHPQHLYRRSQTTGARVEVSSSDGGFMKTNRSLTTPDGRHHSETPEEPARSGSSYTHTVSTGGTSGHKSGNYASGSGRGGARPSTISKGNTNVSKINNDKASKKNFFQKLFGGKKKKGAREKTEYEAVQFESDNEKMAVRDQKEQSKHTHIRSSSDQSALEPPRFEDGALVLEEYSKVSHEDDHEYDRSSVFFAHDEVSTLTAPTMESYYRRRDPSEQERVSEPMGHYWNNVVGGNTVNRDDSGFPAIDPFTEPFFQEPAGASPMPISSTADLRVQVPQVNDPIGESPLNSHKAKTALLTDQHPLHDPSPRGSETCLKTTDLLTQDPIGESPLHQHNRGPTAVLDGTPYAPDPPLYLAALEVETSCSSEKEDDVLSSNTTRGIPVRSSSPASSLTPPRPPSPAKAMLSKTSPRRSPLRITPPVVSNSSPLSSKVRSVSTKKETGPTPASGSAQRPKADASHISQPNQKEQKANAPVSAGSPSAKRSSKPVVQIKKTGIIPFRIGPNMSAGLADSDEFLESSLESISNVGSTDSDKPTSPFESSKQPIFSPSTSRLTSQPTNDLDLSTTQLETSDSADLASPASNGDHKEDTLRTPFQKRAAGRRVRSGTKTKNADDDAAAATPTSDSKASNHGKTLKAEIDVSPHQKAHREDPKGKNVNQGAVKPRKFIVPTVEATVSSTVSECDKSNDGNASKPEISALSNRKTRRGDLKKSNVSNQSASKSRKAAFHADHISTGSTTSTENTCDSSNDGKTSKPEVKVFKSRQEDPNHKSGNKVESDSASESVSDQRISHALSPRAALKAKARANRKSDDDSLSVETDRIVEVKESPKLKTKLLTISSAACMNAKAVAYLHTLNGEPSPRHAWRHPQDSDDEPSPVAGDTKIFLSNKQANAARMEREVHKNKASTLMLERDERQSAPSMQSNVTPSAVVTGASRIFSPYSGKFKGRGLVKKPLFKFGASPRLNGPTETMTFKQPKVPAWKQKKPLRRDITISSVAASTGFNLLRKNREDSVSSGRSCRVVPVRKVKTPTAKSYFGPFEDPEPKDPIHRAGRRLLSRAAVPVQAATRRFLARREAVNRMWALLEIQSYARRWRAEAAFMASRRSAITIQRIYRGSHCRAEIQSQQRAAVQIQKIVRGYIYAIQVYEEVYRVILIQARARGIRCRRESKSMHSSILKIQAQFRAFRARQLKKQQLSSVSKIQALWRSYLIRTCFQFVVVDIIIAQSVLRRWLARKHFVASLANKRNNSANKVQSLYRGFRVRAMLEQYKAACLVQQVWRGFSQRAKVRQLRCAMKIQTMWRRFRCQTAYRSFKAARKLQTTWRLFHDFSSYKKFKAARKIQTFWRSFQCLSMYKKHKAATQIQAIWRGFQGYTDYVFMLVDILVVQRSVRRWLAQKHVDSMRRARAALMIQKNWRRRYAQHRLLVDLMHIILVQSVVRRYLSQGNVITRRHEYVEAQLAARKIQAAWRGFWNYSLYVILRYETVRLQSRFRRRLARVDYLTSLGFCILIQSRIRRYLSEGRVRSMRAERAMVLGQGEGLREVNASKRIQFFWRVVMECRREKKAALVIERFFLMVKREVDREILRAKERKQSRSRRSTTHKKHRNRNDGDSLEHDVWIDSLDMGVFTFARSKSSEESKSLKSDHSVHSRRSSSSKSKLSVGKASSSSFDGSSCFSQGSECTGPRETGHKSGVRHRASSPTLNLVMRHDHDNKSVTSAQMELSTRNSARKNRKGRKGPRSNLSLEANDFEDIDAAMSTEKYMQIYGVRTAPSCSSKEHHFFKESTEMPEKCANTTPKSAISVPTSTKSENSFKSDLGWRTLLSGDSKSIGKTASESSHEPQDRSQEESYMVHHIGKSPRHGKILIMNPYPEFQPPLKGSNQDANLETGYLGEDFGLI